MGTNWYQTLAPRPDADVRLYCLPCAGGGASMFRRWVSCVPPWAELRAILLPGRQARHREPSFTDCETAAEVLAAQLAAQHRPYAVFGHSMGAMIGYRTVQLLAQRNAALPVLLGVACWPVQGIAPQIGTTEVDDDALCDWVVSMGGATSEVLADSELRAMVLPVLRADFALCRSYTYYRALSSPVPVAVYGGGRDRIAPPSSLRTWRRHATQMRGPRIFAGGHFFFQDDPAALASALFNDIQAIMPAPSRRWEQA